MATVENKNGKYIVPTLKSFQDAAAKATLDPKKDFYSIIADPAGDTSYPMVAATFILVPFEKPDMNKRVTKFFDWAYTDGQEIAKSLGFVPLPESLTSKIKTYWDAKGIK